MGTKRGRAVLDWLRHRLGLAVRGEYVTSMQYWDHVYKRKENVYGSEWCGLRYEDFKRYRYRLDNECKESSLGQDLAKEGKTLILGSGTSMLGVEMHYDGFQDITQLDFAKNAEHFTIKEIPFVHGDARHLSSYFAANSFDTIIDKGTIDSIYLSASPNSGSYLERILDGAAYISRRKSGKFLFFSLSQPSYLLPLIHTVRTSPNWEWDRLEVRSLDSIYLYYLSRSNRSYDRSGSKSKIRGGAKTANSSQRLDFDDDLQDKDPFIAHPAPAALLTPAQTTTTTMTTKKKKKNKVS